MQHDAGMRAAARAVYEAVYSTEDWAPVAFEVAERLGTVHYRQAVEAAVKVADCLLTDADRQLALL